MNTMPNVKCWGEKKDWKEWRLLMELLLSYIGKPGKASWGDIFRRK